ncbi:MAG: hypothetical protein K6U74_01205, partial [Firmicutes bacterium]|nr:hypothetical protein [Bacillota bacterium]
IVINATEGGAFIEGTIVKPLREVIAEYMTSEWGIEERIRNLCEKQNGFNAEPEKIIAKARTKLIKTKKLIEHTLPEIEKILLKLKNGSLSPKDYMRIEQIKKNEDRLLESLEYQHIIKTIIYGRILYYERYYSRLASEQPEKVELWVAEYQKILFESARDALNAFFSETKDLAGNDKRNEES